MNRLSCLSAALALATPSLAASHGADHTVTFEAADGSARYEGTLTLPASPSPVPLVVLLSVAGPNDRDQTVGENRGFAEIAATLAARGIASIRFDDRGVGGSDGDYFAASWEDHVADALAARNAAASHPSVDAERFGFAGMSQGGALAAMACIRAQNCSFAVMMSPPGVPGEEALRGQLEGLIAASGLGNQQADAYRALMDELFAIVRSDDADRTSRLAAFLAGPGGQLIPPYRFLPRDPAALAQVLAGGWYRSNVTFDPAQAYAGLTGPVLVMGGSRDRVLPPQQHWKGLRSVLPPQSDYFEIATGNHLLQRSETGLPNEYAELAHAIDPAAAAIVAAWVEAQVKPAQ